jgi:hypothetical protein
LPRRFCFGESKVKTITVDGVQYVPLQETGPIKIVVIERGFVYVGRVCPNEKGCTIHGARSLIRWGSSQHLGELVGGPLKETKLGASCTVLVTESQIIHMIEVDQNAWNKHITG